MFALGLRYLNGWAMAAADGARKERAEWPPHPDRVFMALSAAWFETGQAEDEGAALRWLEGLSPPSISASDCSVRAEVKVYVPVNDTSTPFENEKKGSLATSAESYPLGRPRRDRRFPTAIPLDPDVYLCWDGAIPAAHRAPLVSLCRKVASVGHSASFVQMWLEGAPPNANWVPVTGLGEHRLRVFGPGRLDDLERRCNREAVITWGEFETRIDAAAKPKEKKMLKEQQGQHFPAGRPVSLRPVPGLWQGYGTLTPPDEPDQPGSLFDPRLIVLALSGQRLSLHSTLKLTEALRGAMLKACPQPIPEWVSGHAADGRASARPHVALLPLPFVDHEHADGRLMGVALALPRAVDPAEAAALIEPWLRDGEFGLPMTLELFDGPWLDCLAELETRENPPVSLRASAWTRRAQRWASVTPVVLDRHCDGKDKWEKAAEVVKDACERIGLPRPVDVLLHPNSLLRGVPSAREFPYLTRKTDGGRMHHAHAVLAFDREVEGPILIGAGRFRGYGLCRPLCQGGESHG